MYSQLKTDQSSNGVEKPWSMDMITRRSKRRSSILGKGRTSVRLSIASTVSSVVETSPAKIEVTKTRATTGAARKPIAEDVLRHFARTNGINPLNPFASQLKESVGSGQSLDENDQGSTSCSAPSSSSEGSARKEDPDITGVFFMDDVESVKKRQQLDSAFSLGDAENGASLPPSHHHLVPCNLMTKEPFRNTFKDKDTFKEPLRDTFKDKDTFKEPLKDQSVRLNRRGVTSSSASKRRTMGASDKPSRDYSSTHQPVLSPVAPVLRSSSLSFSSSLSASLRTATEPDPTSDMRRSLSTTDLTNCIAATASSRDALRAASEMQFEEMCKTRCESVAPLSGDLFVSKKSSTKVRSSALDQMGADTQDRQSRRSSALDHMGGDTQDRKSRRSSALDQMGADSQDRKSRRSSSLDQMGADTQDRQSRRSSAFDQMGADTHDRQSHRVRSSDSTALDQMGGHTQDRSSTKVQSSDHTTLNQMDTHTYKTHLDSRSTGKSKGRYSVALHTSDSNTSHENHTKKSRPSIMSDLIINHKNKYDVDDIFSKKDKDSKKYSDEKKSSETDLSSRSKYIDDLLKRIDLSVKANKHTDDEPAETRNIDGSSSKIVNDKMETRGTVEERSSTSIFLNDSVVSVAERSFSVNDREVVGNRAGSSKLMNDLNGGSDAKEVCNKFNRTLNFEDCDNNDEDDDDGDRTFVYNESACNNTLLVNGNTSAGKLKKLSLIEEEEEHRSRMSSASANENDDTSPLESTIRGGNISAGSTDLNGKIGDKMAAILDCLKESQRVFTRRQAEFVEQLNREQDEFVRRQNEKIADFDRFATSFQQEQATTLAALCEDVANLVAGNSSDDDVFHTAMKKPLNVETKDSSAIYSSLKSDFKCLKTPNARVNKKAAANLNKTILTPHSMSVCVQEQVSMLFDS